MLCAGHKVYLEHIINFKPKHHLVTITVCTRLEAKQVLIMVAQLWYKAVPVFILMVMCHWGVPMCNILQYILTFAYGNMLCRWTMLVRFVLVSTGVMVRKYFVNTLGGKSLILSSHPMRFIYCFMYNQRCIRACSDHPSKLEDNATATIILAWWFSRCANAAGEKKILLKLCRQCKSDDAKWDYG